MTLSILHRMTGVALSIGFFLLVVWLESLAFGEPGYNAMTSLLGTLPGQIVLLGFSFAFFFHLANGVRHLFWDVGMGFEKGQAQRSAWFVVVASVVLTAAFWLLLTGTGS